MDDTKYEIVKFIDNDFELDVNISPKESNVWLTQKEIALLYEKDRKTITRHIQNIIKDLELDKNTVSSKYEHTANDGKRYIVNIYNLDMILAIGYRVKSKRGILFRQWSTKILKEYLLKGYVINEKRCLACEDNIISLNNEIKKLSSRTDKIENKLNSDYFKDKLILGNEIYEAFSFLKNLINKVSKNLIIIDSYVSNKPLDLLVDVNKQLLYIHFQILN